MSRRHSRVRAPAGAAAGLLVTALLVALVAEGAGAVPAAGVALPAPVRAVLARRDVPAQSLSVYVADLETGEVAVDWLKDTARNPASVLKLVTTLVALDVLSPAYRWSTDVYALGEIDGGRLDGDLLLKGSGDPFLVTERVWQLTRALRRLGLDTIDGDLLIDDSHFELADYDPGAFDRQPLRAYNVAPNALLMNFKLIRYWFTPQPRTNSVRIALEPPLANVAIDNRLTLKAGPCRGFQRGIAVKASEDMDRMIFSGRFPAACRRYSLSRSALDHKTYAYGLFAAMWRENGGRLSGSGRPGLAPEDLEPLLKFRSAPLGEALTRINKYSNNVMARQLLMTLSAEILGVPGTEAGGRVVIRQWLDEHGLDVDSLAIANGAGLSRSARISARDLVSLLGFAWRQPYMPEYLASMALSGLDGTLRDRLKGRGLLGQAHLKTGSLDDVAAIAGYLQAADGRRYALAILNNHEDIHRGYGEEIQDALLRWLYARR